MSATGTYQAEPNHQSPQKLLAGSAVNYAAHSPRASQQSRDALRRDLEGRIEYDVDILDKFLGVGVVSADIVNRCAAKINASASIGDFTAVVVSRESNEVKYRETDMYEPLVSNSLLMLTQIAIDYDICFTENNLRYH
jgi:hypothetical protein